MTSSIHEPPNTLPAEFPDEMLTLAREFGAPGYAHLFLPYPARLDAERLGRAVRLLIDAEPVLGCRFEATGAGSRWRRHEDPDSMAWLEVATAPDFDTAVSSVMLTEETPTDRTVVVRLFSLPEHDLVAITIDHAAGDGAALVECAYHLAELYTLLRDRPDHRPVPNATARDGFEWLQGLSGRDKARTVIRDLGAVGRARLRPTGIAHSHTLDSWMAVPRCAPRFIDRRIGPSDLDAIGRFARSNGSSVFALLVSAMARAFVDFAGVDANRPIQIQTVTDLRRFVQAHERPPIRNMVASASLIFRPARHEPFTVTLENAKREVERLRTGMRGAMNPIAVSLVRRLSHATKRRLTEKALRAKFRGPVPLTFSHAGRVQEERVRFDGIAPERVLLIGGWMPMPVLLIVGLEYRRTLSLSVGFQDNDIPSERVRGFLDGIVGQMPVERSEDGAGRSSSARAQKGSPSST
ncbi:MAG: hypothetical protein KIS73_13115 [Enhydrobacter sp.]|nr:hypothetical protein [Enhydrobacter sp.]